MVDQHVLYSKEDGIGIITLNRPEKMNAITFDMLDRLDSIVEEVRTDEQVRVVILTGNGRAFSAGTDISEPVTATPEAQVEAMRRRN